MMLARRASRALRSASIAAQAWRRPPTTRHLSAAPSTFIYDVTSGDFAPKVLQAHRGNLSAAWVASNVPRLTTSGDVHIAVYDLAPDTAAAGQYHRTPALGNNSVAADEAGQARKHAAALLKSMAAADARGVAAALQCDADRVVIGLEIDQRLATKPVDTMRRSTSQKTLAAMMRRLTPKSSSSKKNVVTK